MFEHDCVAPNWTESHPSAKNYAKDHYLYYFYKLIIHLQKETILQTLKKERKKSSLDRDLF